MTTTRTTAVEAEVATRWNKGIAVTVGILFFFQLITFLVGSSLIETYLAGNAGRASLTMGVLLEMAAGLAVVAIGILMFSDYLLPFEIVGIFLLGAIVGAIVLAKTPSQADLSGDER